MFSGRRAEAVWCTGISSNRGPTRLSVPGAIFGGVLLAVCGTASSLFGGLELTPDNITGTETAEEVNVVTTGVAAAAVVSTTVEVDVVTTAQVTVGGVTTGFGNDVVATAATIPVVFVVVTVAVGVVDGAVQVLIPGVAGAAVTAIAGGEQGGSPAFVWQGVVTVDAATLELSTVTGEVVVAAVTAEVTVHRAGDGTEGATGAITVIGAGLILRNCRPEAAWRVLAPGIFCCRAPALFITNWANTPPGEGRAALDASLSMSQVAFSGD